LVFDTMVFAYALLRSPGLWEECANAFEKTRAVVVPELFRAELLNVLWQSVCCRSLSLQAACELFLEARALVTRVVPTDAVWQRALSLAVAKRHSPYDMLFVATAVHTGSRLLTYDRRLQSLCPEHVLLVPEYLHR